MNALHLRLSALLLAASVAAVPRALAEDRARPDPGELSVQEYEILDQFISTPSDRAAMMRLAEIKAQGRAVEVLGDTIRKANTDSTLPQSQPVWASGLEYFHDRAAPLLAELAHDKSTSVRQVAIRLLAFSVEEPTPEVLAACREALDDPDTNVVEMALGAPARHPDPEAGPKVLELMHTPEGKESPSPVAQEAMRVIRFTHYAPALLEFCRMAGDEDVERREIAAASIALCAKDAAAEDQQQAVTALLRLAGDPNPSVALSAATGLAELRNPAGIPVILFHLKTFANRPTDSWDGLYDEASYVEALQRCSGMDFHASPLEWKFDTEKINLSSKLETLRLQIESITTQLNAAGIATSGYPRLPKTLTDADKAMLDRAFANWLIDPAGGTLVECTFQLPNPYGGQNATTTHGWYFPAGEGKPERLLLPDGTAVTKWDEKHPADIVALSKKLIEAAEKGDVAPPPPIDAAWLYRLGHEDLAAASLYLARSGIKFDLHLEHPSPEDGGRSLALAYTAFASGDDAAARTTAERFINIYTADSAQLAAARALLEDMQRRQKEPAQTHPDAPPPDLQKWPVDKQIAFLIAELQEISGTSNGFGAMDFGDDWRVKELIRLGDAAMPALLDCLEKDPRFMRFSMNQAQNRFHNFDGFNYDARQTIPIPHLVRIRDAAFFAVVNILQTTALNISGETQLQFPQGDDQWKTFIEAARGYWDRFGKLPLDQRMLAILADPKVSPAAAADAASVLACFGKPCRYWYGNFSRESYGPGETPNPLIARIQHPTLAEQLLAFHDRIVKSLRDQGKEDEAEDFADRYLETLQMMRDAAVIPELKRRYAHEGGLRTRLRMAMLCLRLDDPEPLKDFAAAFKSGTLRPGSDAADAAPYKLGAADLSRIIQPMTSLGQPYVDEALRALADAAHPYHAPAVQAVLTAIKGSSNGSYDAMLQHPYYIALVRSMLDDTSPTGGIYQVNPAGWSSLTDENQQTTSQNNRSFQGEDISKLREATRARACDAVAIYLSSHLLGLPTYHPLQRDREDRLAQLRDYLNRYGDALVPVDYRIYAGTNHYWGGGVLMPALPKINGNPTAAQRASGKVLLDLGDVLPVPLSLPATARLRSATEEEPRVLIVQVARDWNGTTHYGILSEDGISTVTDDEITDIQEPESSE